MNRLLFFALFLTACPSGDVPVEPPDVPPSSCVTVSHEADGDGPGPVAQDPFFGTRPTNDFSNIQATTVDIDGVQLLYVQTTVRTFDDHFGFPWEDTVTVVAPLASNLSSTNSAALIAQSGTLNAIGAGDSDPTWPSLPSWFKGTENSSNFRYTWGSIAAEFGIPVVFGNAVPDRITLPDSVAERVNAALLSSADPCDELMDCNGNEGVLDSDGDITNCLKVATLLEEDIRYDPGINFAVAQSRILDAGQEIVNALYEDEGVEVNWDEVFVAGSSKRGRTMRMLSGMDSRVVGVLNAASQTVATREFHTLMSGVWERGFTPTMGDLMTGPFAEELERAISLPHWKPEVVDDTTFVFAVGTNDPLLPLASTVTFQDSLPENARFLLVPNYGHGMGTVDHAAVFRSMIGEQLAGWAWPQVTAEWTEGGVVARVSDGSGAVLSDSPTVDLWCSVDESSTKTIHVFDEHCDYERLEPSNSTDLRLARWSRVNMVKDGDGVYSANPPETSLSYPACIVRAVTQHGTVATSPVILSTPLCEAVGELF